MSIEIKAIKAGYDEFELNDLSLDIVAGSFTVLTGPNGCGKSTLLKACADQLELRTGEILIGDSKIGDENAKLFAQKVAILPQHPIVPNGITVEQLIAYGRTPHQNFLGLKSDLDKEKIDEAIAISSLEDFRNRKLTDLSGGQTQRAFIAMCIAQDTPYLLLDEPTSFLDIKYQYEILDLLAELNESGKTIVAVLHDIAQASRYASELVVMKEGRIYARGEPQAAVTENMLCEVYGLKAHVYADPITQTPVISRT